MPTMKSEQFRRSEPNTGYRQSFDALARKKFYQGKAWKALRARLHAEHSARHRREASNIYTANPAIPHADLVGYLGHPPAPLCVACLTHNRMTAAYALDHIVPIGEGGAELDPANLQWLCRHHHQSKSAQERV